MAKSGKRILNNRKTVDRERSYDLDAAIGLVKNAANAKFDETVDLAINLGVNPKHADQMVRGAVSLPHGTGKSVRVLVFAKGEKEKEALDAGADFVGNDEIVQKIQGGWLDFDKSIATPDMMGLVGKIGRVLGPRGLMPNPKVGTVTFDVAQAVKELKAGKVDFKVEKAGILHVPIGRASFGLEMLRDNAMAILESVVRLKPSSSKGTYVKAISLSSTMGPGVKIDADLVHTLVR